MTPEEKALIDRLQQGDESALGEVVSVNKSRLMSLAFRFVHSPEDAEEVVFKAFNNFHRFIVRGAFRGECSISTVLFRFVKNGALNRRKHNLSRGWGRTLSMDAPIDGAGEEVFSALIPDTCLSPSETFDLVEIDEAIAKAAVRLKPKHRDLLARRLEGATYETLAKEFHISIGTVKSRIGRARDALRRLVDLPTA